MRLSGPLKHARDYLDRRSTPGRPGQPDRSLGGPQPEAPRGGIHLADHRLHDVSAATTVRVRDGRTIVATGPSPRPRSISPGDPEGATAVRDELRRRRVGRATT
ncbi:hypothetical protein [Georgenia sp. SUBG003]|uniref:hypothetical protein n=1 Tax=Georgenia sp. SUBG003 TaxID=1497974 RepID=UPI003AB361F7